MSLTSTIFRSPVPAVKQRHTVVPLSTHVVHPVEEDAAEERGCLVYPALCCGVATRARSNMLSLLYLGQSDRLAAAQPWWACEGFFW